MKFKQICNHPDQYLGQEVYAEQESGKYARLREICETIREKRERVLVFTQFKEITEPLAGFLATVFGRDGLVLHGGTPVARRREIVARFQGHDYVPFMVLSIKAGGVGLNLTAANHVIHFDRWWNPAVENQATDRAFRIGQRKNVIVHKFITQGTVEERIDRMIEEKTALSKEIVPDINESWLTEMDNSELMALFRLGALGKMDISLRREGPEWSKPSIIIQMQRWRFSDAFIRISALCERRGEKEENGKSGEEVEQRKAGGGSGRH